MNWDSWVVALVTVAAALGIAQMVAWVTSAVAFVWLKLTAPEHIPALDRIADVMERRERDAAE